MDKSQVMYWPEPPSEPLSVPLSVLYEVVDQFGAQENTYCGCDVESKTINTPTVQVYLTLRLNAWQARMNLQLLVVSHPIEGYPATVNYRDPTDKDGLAQKKEIVQNADELRQAIKSVLTNSYTSSLLRLIDSQSQVEKLQGEKNYAAMQAVRPASE